MKNTITRPAPPALPDTLLLNYAKGFLPAGQMRPKQNVPGTAARNGISGRQTKRLWAEEQGRLLDEQIARYWDEEDEPLCPQRRNIIPKPALADTGNLKYDDLNADLRAYDWRNLRGIEHKGEIQNALLTAEEAKEARPELLPRLDLSEPKLTLYSLASGSAPLLTGRQSDVANSGKNNAGAGSNPYSHMGIQDADYRAYREGKLTEDDLIGIARAVALYYAADGSSDGAYYYQNAAHDRAAEIRMKYNPNYRKNDIYDNTHGGRYDSDNIGPIPGPPRYEVPIILSVNARVSTGQDSGHSVYTSPRPPKKKDKESEDSAPDFGDNDKDKTALYELGPMFGDMANLYDQNSFFVNGKKQVENKMKSLATIFAMGDPQMKAVADEIFDHFINGNGDAYSNPVLTEKVLQHPSTQEFIIKTMETVQDYLKINNGNLAALGSDEDFRDKIDEISRPKFNTKGDLISGLTICLNDTWGYYIDIADYQSDGKHYSGTIRYTVYDHFGLDEADISGDNWYKGAFEPFAAWYVLQHYKGCEEQYQPFVTYMEFEVPFSGSVD